MKFHRNLFLFYFIYQRNDNFIRWRLLLFTTILHFFFLFIFFHEYGNLFLFILLKFVRIFFSCVLNANDTVLLLISSFFFIIYFQPIKAMNKNWILMHMKHNFGDMNGKKCKLIIGNKVAECANEKLKFKINLKTAATD